jgi:DNA-binding transcriptional regulator/RsmH inhibitor MraZ
MHRREFIKLGILSVPAMYLSPKMVGDWTAEMIEEPPKAECGKLPTFFRGRHHRVMRNGQATLPKDFTRTLAKTRVHFFGEARSGGLRLIPDSLFHEEAFQKEWVETSRSISDFHLCYFGDGLVSQNGRLRIPGWVREQAGMADGEMVIVGFLDVIEIWNKRTWDAEVERVKEFFSSEPILRVS